MSDDGRVLPADGADAEMERLYLTNAPLHYCVDTLVTLFGLPRNRTTMLRVAHVLDSYAKMRVAGESARLQAESLERALRAARGPFVPRSIG